MIISRLEQNLNRSLGINNQELSLVTIESIPKIKLPSIRDVVDTEVYDVVREPTGKKSRPSQSDEVIFTQFFSVKPELIRSNTEKTVNTSLSIGKKKAQEIVESRIATVTMQKRNQIKEAIDFMEKHLNEKIQERKALGENILSEIEQIESDLDLTRQMITSLTELLRFAENFQLN